MRLEAIAAPLLEWYRTCRRDLPWRGTKDPYRIWVSEIMLQQTRVETVKPYYERFMRELPTITELALCPDDKLMKLWEGLGYYSRAANLKKAAGVILRDYQGIFPTTADEIIKLPGIGAYTAGAIASIAFDEAVPAVDGNVMRIWARVTGTDEDILQDKVKKEATRQLTAIMPVMGAGDLNQAFMDLGATICIPKGEILCGSCPIQDSCTAYEQHMTDRLPVRRRAAARRQVELTVLVIWDSDSIALHKRPDKGLLAGLYELPNVEGHLTPKEAARQVRARGLDPLKVERLPDSRHIFSHVEWHMMAYSVRIAALAREASAGDWFFADKEAAREAYPLPSAFSAYAAFLQKRPADS